MDIYIWTISRFSRFWLLWIKLLWAFGYIKKKKKRKSSIFNKQRGPCSFSKANYKQIKTKIGVSRFTIMVYAHFSANHTKLLLKVNYMNCIAEESCRKYQNQWTSGVMGQMIITGLKDTRHIITDAVFWVEIHKKIIIWNYHEKNASFMQISVHIYLPCSLTWNLYLNSPSYQYTDLILPNYFSSPELLFKWTTNAIPIKSVFS